MDLQELENLANDPKYFNAYIRRNSRYDVGNIGDMYDNPLARCFSQFIPSDWKVYVTPISVGFVHMIENGDFTIFPTPQYAVDFLKVTADYQSETMLGQTAQWYQSTIVK